MTLYLAGFVKCGQTSLVKLLDDEINWQEDILHKDGFENFLKVKESQIPIVIIRNRVDAIWSMFWFYKYNERMTFTEFLMIDNPNSNYGNESPLYRTDFIYHYSKYIPYGLIVYNLDELVKIESFPHENKTRHPEITEVERKVTELAISNYNLEGILKSKEIKG